MFTKHERYDDAVQEARLFYLNTGKQARILYWVQFDSRLLYGYKWLFEPVYFGI